MAFSRELHIPTAPSLRLASRATWVLTVAYLCQSSDADTRWLDTAMFNPKNVGGVVLALPGQPPSFELASGGAFNPSLFPLTPRWRSMLHPFESTRDAVFLAAFRFRGEQCHRLATEHDVVSETTLRMKRCGSGGHAKACTSTVFALLDKHFAYVEDVVTGPKRPKRPGHHPRPQGLHPDSNDLPQRVLERFGEDVRLDLVRDEDGRDRVVASFMTHGDGTRGDWYRGRELIGDDWHANEVHMFVASPAGVVFLDIDHPAYFLNLSQRMPSSAWRGRNFGFVSDEEDKIPRVVLWPSQPLATVPARGSRNVDRPPLAIWASESAMARGGKETLHNNVSPVRLPSHNNSLLVLAHSHQPPFFAPRRSDEEKKHLPLYGLKYMHTWLLAEGDYPFRIIAQSPPFCLPSPQNARRCETIQYVTTMLLSDDGSELILGYGVNDCDSRIQRLPLKSVLDFTRSGTVVLSDRPLNITA